MKAYGVLVAFVHDIGMVDLSPVGRAMHPEFATQAVLGPEFDDIMARLWATRSWRDRGRLGEGAAGLSRAQSPEAVRGKCWPWRTATARARCRSRS